VNTQHHPEVTKWQSDPTEWVPEDEDFPPVSVILTEAGVEWDDLEPWEQDLLLGRDED
jgi:hypothetical protein